MSDEIKLLMVDDDAELLALLKVKLEKKGRFSVPIQLTAGKTNSTVGNRSSWPGWIISGKPGLCRCSYWDFPD